MAADSNTRRSRLAGGKAGDAVVMMGMALVTLALGAGLVLQTGLGLWLAGTVSLSFYIGLLTLHAIARRSGQIDALMTEVEHLKSALAAIEGAHGAATVPSPAGPRPGSVSGVGVAASAAPAPAAVASSAPSPAASSGVERGLSGSQPPPAYAPRQPQEAPLGPPALPPSAASQSRPAPAASVRPEPARPAAEPSANPDLAARMQRVVRGPAAAAAATVPPPPLVAERTHGDNVKPSPALRQPAPPVQPQPPQPPQSPAGSSSAAPLETAATPPPAEADETPTEIGMPRSRTEPAAAASPREADVEMIQGLIRKLAQEVNAAEADKLAPVAVGAAAGAGLRAIEDSVGALKRTAATMRQPARAASFDDDLNAHIAQRRAAVEAPAPVAPPVSPPAAKAGTAASPATGVTAAEADRAPAGEPEFDFDKLMRRAQPIAVPPRTVSDDEEARLERAAAELAPHFAAAAAPPAEAAPLAPAVTAGLTAGMTADMTANGPARAAPSAAPAHAPGFKAEPEPATPVSAVIDDASGQRLEQIAAALDAGRVEVFLEPILDLARQQPSHYEVSVRLRDEDGREIEPLAAADDGEASPDMPLLDSIRLSRTAQVAGLLEDRRKPGSVFSTFNGPSLASDDFLSTFVETYDARQSLAAQLVLTFAQADVRRFRAPHWAMIQEMRELGFRFALRAVTDLDMDFEALVAAGFGYVKLDAEVFLQGLPAPGDVIAPADLCNHLAGYGLSLVVEQIDDEAKRARIFGFGVLLGQGQLFGGPRLMKASALAGSQKAA